MFQNGLILRVALILNKIAQKLMVSLSTVDEFVDMKVLMMMSLHLFSGAYWYVRSFAYSKLYI